MLKKEIKEEMKENKPNRLEKRGRKEVAASTDMNTTKNEPNSSRFHSSILKPVEASRTELADTRFPSHIHYSWKPPHNIRKHTPAEFAALRQEMRVEVTGRDLPPIIPQFHQMRLPKFLQNLLQSLSLTKPTSLQMQCIPSILQGRNILSISPHHSGKHLAYAIPLFLFSMEEEMKLQVLSNEGPIALVLCSSRDAASTAYSVASPSFPDRARRSRS